MRTYFWCCRMTRFTAFTRAPEKGIGNIHDHDADAGRVSFGTSAAHSHLGRYPQQGDGLHNGVTGVGDRPTRCYSVRGKRSLQTRRFPRATSRMVIIFTALFEFLKMLTNAPLAGGYLSAPPPVAA